MSVDFDAANGTLRLDAEAFITLAELSSEAVDPCDTTFARLVDAGAVLDGVPHPLLRPGLAAVAGSLASLQVLVAGPRDVRLHHGWLSGDAALLTDLGDGTYDFASVSVESVPESIARVTHVGPRPRLAAGSAVIDESVLDDLASGSTRARASGVEALADLLAPWPGAAAVVHAGGWRLALVDVAFVDEGRTVARRLAWLDTDAGMLRVEADDHGPVLVPVGTTELWRAVVAVLPGDLDAGPVARSA
ncbi:MAG: hypothetical protein HOQ21_10260 [Dermatophilaceae bacterium]|nr:hypothetical protein [Dermatophilaceae bacterium]